MASAGMSVGKTSLSEVRTRSCWKDQEVSREMCVMPSGGERSLSMRPITAACERGKSGTVVI